MPSALLYDSDCGFCRTCVGVLLAWDRDARLEPVAIQSAEGERLLADLAPGERLGSWHLVMRAGAWHAPGGSPPAAAGGATGAERRSAGAAFPLLLRQLPGGRPLAALAGRFPDATDRGYRWVAGHRGPLGRALPTRLTLWADRRIANRGKAGPVASR